MQHEAPPSWLWAIAGGVIAWMAKLLKDTLASRFNNESRENEKFRESIRGDLKELSKRLSCVERQLSGIEATLKVRNGGR